MNGYKRIERNTKIKKLGKEGALHGAHHTRKSSHKVFKWIIWRWNRQLASKKYYTIKGIQIKSIESSLSHQGGERQHYGEATKRTWVAPKRQQSTSWR